MGMRGILRKKLLRDLGKAWPRYLALGLMILLSMYLIISLIGAADTIIIGSARLAEANRVEDGQFTTFVPLSAAELAALRGQGVTVEPMFFRDYALDDGSVLRVFRLRQEIDLEQLEVGALPESDGEILLEKRYCEEKGLGPGDAVALCGQELAVSGIATTPDYDTVFRSLGDSTVDSASFSTAFVTPTLYDRLAAAAGALTSEEYLYAYRLNGATTDEALKARLDALDFDPEAVDDPFFREYWDRTGGKRDELLDGVEDLADGATELRDTLRDIETDLLGKEGSVARRMMPKSLVDDMTDLAEGGEDLADGAQELRDGVVEAVDRYFDVDVSNLREFVTREDNPRIGGAADDVVINKYASLAAGVIIMALLTYVISVFVVNNIAAEQTVIGTLYALGLRRRELTWHYLLTPVLVSLVAGAAGTALGYSPLGVPTQTADTYAYFSVPALSTVVELPVLLYGIVMPPLVAAAVNWGVIRKKLSAPALQLLRGETRHADVSRLDLGGLGYIRRFQIRQLLREGRSAAGVVLGLFVCLLLMMIGLDAWVMCDNVKADNVADTRYEYMYLYKYPEETVPEGAWPAYAVTGKKEALGYNMDVTLLGLSEGNPFFDASPKKSQRHVQISSAMAQKYGLGAGDAFTVSDGQADRIYAFTVDRVVDYAPAFYVFMDLDSMRELFGAPDDYFNVAFSDRPLPVDPGRLYSVSSRADVVRAAGVFVDLMRPMVVTMIAASALIMVIVMYLMMKVMLDHAAQSIALFKIFGYRRGELNRLFLNGNTLLIVVGALISIPLSKAIMDALYPYLVSNVACAMDLTFEPWLYGLLFAGCLALYFVIYALLTRRLHRINPNEVLKRRE